MRKKKVSLEDIKLASEQMEVGFIEGASSHENIQKARWQEFGTKGGASGGGWGGPIPERPFMRNSIRNNTEKYQAAIRNSVPSILSGKVSIQSVLRRIGEVAKKDMKEEMASLSSPPNAPATIKIKGFDNPLIDTKSMMNDVRYKLKGIKK